MGSAWFHFSLRHRNSLLGEVRSSLDHTSATGLSQEVAREGRTCTGEVGEHASPRSLVRGHPEYASQHPHGARQGSRADSEVPEFRLAESGKMLGISTMGPRSASTGDRRPQDSEVQPADSQGCPGNAKASSDGSRDTSIPRHQEAGHVFIGGLDARHGLECAGTSRDGSTSIAHGLSRVISVPVDRSAVPAGLVEAQPPGGAPAEAVGEKLKAMVLLNQFVLYEYCDQVSGVGFMDVDQ